MSNKSILVFMIFLLDFFARFFLIQNDNIENSLQVQDMGQCET